MPVSPAFMQALQHGAELGARLRAQQAAEQNAANQLRLSFAERAMRQQAHQSEIQQQQAMMALRERSAIDDLMFKQAQLAQQGQIAGQRMASDDAQAAAQMGFNRDKFNLDKTQGEDLMRFNREKATASNLLGQQRLSETEAYHKALADARGTRSANPITSGLMQQQRQIVSELSKVDVLPERRKALEMQLSQVEEEAIKLGVPMVPSPQMREEVVAEPDNRWWLTKQMGINKPTSTTNQVPFYPSGAPQMPGNSSKVMVKKDGKRFWLPQSQLDEALKQGYEQAQ